MIAMVTLVKVFKLSGCGKRMPIALVDLKPGQHLLTETYYAEGLLPPRYPVPMIVSSPVN